MFKNKTSDKVFSFSGVFIVGEFIGWVKESMSSGYIHFEVL